MNYELEIRKYEWWWRWVHNIDIDPKSSDNNGAGGPRLRWDCDVRLQTGGPRLPHWLKSSLNQDININFNFNFNINFNFNFNFNINININFNNILFSNLRFNCSR